MTTFNPASFTVAGFVDVTNMSHANRKRLAQNDDEGYMPAGRGPAVVVHYSPTTTRFVAELLAAASRFAQRTDDFSFGKPATCRDLAEKLERFGSFASDKQADFAYKLIGWSLPRGAAHPLDGNVPAKAPASPVAASKPVAQAVTLPKLFDLMQRLSKLTIGKLTIARKNQDSLCWVKVDHRTDVVGKIEGGVLSIFTGRMGMVEANELRTALLRIEADPEAAAVMHGKVSGRCSICSRDLTDPVSVARGVGPICVAKAGW